MSSRLLLTLAALTTALACSCPAAASTEQARLWYDRGLQLIEQRDLVAAKRAFERAYAESPHPAVLFNLARICEQLDQPREGLDYVKRFLQTAAGELGPERREQAQALRVRLQARVMAETVPEASSAKAPSTAPAPGFAAAGAEGVRRRAPPMLAPMSAAPGVAAVAPTRADVPLAVPRLAPPPAFTVSVASVGAVLASTSLSLRLWNNGRYATWRAESDALAQVAWGELESDPELSASHARRRSANARLRESIERHDIVSVASAVTGLGLLAAASYLYFSVSGDDGAGSSAASAAPGWRLGFDRIGYHGSF